MNASITSSRVERPLAPTYRIDRSFEWNWQHGPHFDGPWPAVPATPMKTFLGFPVRSRFGIPPQHPADQSLGQDVRPLGLRPRTHE